MNEAVGRCEAHLKKCSYVPESVLQSLFGSNYPITSSLSSSSLPPSLSLSSSSLSSTSLSSSSSSSSTITNFIDRISGNEQNELELLFARSIYQCGLSLSLSELEPMKVLSKRVCPAFKLPNRKKLSNELHDRVFLETSEEVERLIENAEYISLVSD